MINTPEKQHEAIVSGHMISITLQLLAALQEPYQHRSAFQCQFDYMSVQSVTAGSYNLVVGLSLESKTKLNNKNLVID